MEATEEAVKTRASHASYLHFATHGLLDEGEPLLSGLALAQDQDPAEDGLLQAFEILRLPLVADLVVLSGCNTGLGAITDGEGVLGLTRAFMHAGARSMVISLWEVNDRSTAGLMEGFYRARFTDRKPADLALQEAKLAAVRAGLPAREWAPFCFVGAADIALPRRNLGPLALFAVVGVSVLAAIGIIATALTRRRA
jgi:CHAT domain-containing protein